MAIPITRPTAPPRSFAPNMGKNLQTIQITAWIASEIRIPTLSYPFILPPIRVHSTPITVSSMAMAGKSCTPLMIMPIKVKKYGPSNEIIKNPPLYFLIFCVFQTAAPEAPASDSAIFQIPAAAAAPLPVRIHLLPSSPAARIPPVPVWRIRRPGRDPSDA